MPHEWSIKEICDLVKKKCGNHPCWYRIKVALALHAEKNVVSCAATGAGKTLLFWIALLMALSDGKDKMIFIMTLLNLLEKQNVTALEKVGLSVMERLYLIFSFIFSLQPYLFILSYQVT